MMKRTSSIREQIVEFGFGRVNQTARRWDGDESSVKHDINDNIVTCYNLI